LQARKNHGDISGGILTQHDPNSFLFNQHDRDVIRAAVVSHSSSEDIDKECREFRDEFHIADYAVRPRFIAALVRLADELDEDYRRAPQLARDITQIPQGSDFYWLFNRRISGIHLNRNQQMITIEAKFEIADFDRIVEVNKKKQPFISAFIEKLGKINEERRYTNKFFPPELKYLYINVNLRPPDMNDSSVQTRQFLFSDDEVQPADIFSQHIDKVSEIIDEQFMLEAIEEAKQSHPLRESDPRVGAVLVKDGQSIRRAFSSGEESDKHAEYILLCQNLKNRSEFVGATLYVTVEPCSSCVEHIINSGVSKVVSGSFDLNSENKAAQGNSALSERGIRVKYSSGQIRGVIDEMNRDFIQYYSQDFEPLIKRYLTDTQTKHDRESEHRGKQQLLQRYNGDVYNFDKRPILAFQLLGAGCEYFTMNEVHPEWSAEKYVLPDQLARLRPKVLAKLVDAAKSSGAPFFNGPCTRLLDYRPQPTDETAKSERKHLELTLGPAGWFDYSIANDWFSPILHNKIVQGQIDDIFEFVNLDDVSRGGRFSGVKLSNIVSTATTILTKDGYIVFSRRGYRTSASPNSYTCAVAENIHYYKDLLSESSDCPSPFHTIRRGLSEEISPDLVSYISPLNSLLLGISFDLGVFHPDLLFVVALPLSYDEILGMRQKRKGIDFYEGQPVGVKCTLDNRILIDYLNDPSWIPSGLASVIRTIEFVQALADKLDLDFSSVLSTLCEGRVPLVE